MGAALILLEHVSLDDYMLRNVQAIPDGHRHEFT